MSGLYAPTPATSRDRGNKMPRIIGVDIPGNKQTLIALTYIHGIGRTSARKIVEETGVDGNAKSQSLTEDELSKIAAYIDGNFVVEGRLRRQVNLDVRRLMNVGTYRGARHRRGLPVRGQRTRTNARTRKGPRKTIARKKGVKEVGKG